MMKVFLTVILIAYCVQSNAQNVVSADSRKYNSIPKDTINIRGVVYDYFDKPVSHFFLLAHNILLANDGYPSTVITNSDGKFTMNGVLANDTLTYYWGEREYKLLVRGSRYIELHLPPLNHEIVKDTVRISAKRIVKKEIPTFKVLIREPMGGDVFYTPTRIAPTPGKFVSVLQS